MSKNTRDSGDAPVRQQEDLAERAARILGTEHPEAGSLIGDLSEAERLAAFGNSEALALQLLLELSLARKRRRTRP